MAQVRDPVRREAFIRQKSPARRPPARGFPAHPALLRPRSLSEAPNEPPNPPMRFPFFRKKAPEPVIRKRADHNISRKNIAPEALQVLYRLSDSGFVAYLVGGSVRDLLLGREPKDFDVATDAYPRQIKKLFRNAHLIGRRFRLALICFRDRQIETSTFRREPDETEAEDDGRPGALYRSEDNLFGTPEQDAQRRDFTVNGLFYDIKTFDVIDYVGGLEDLERRVLRSIGDPNVRFREDPVRMMRAVRFAAKLGFTIHRDSERAILRHHAEISNASPPRLFDEILRLFDVGAAPSFRRLHELRLMEDLLPAVHAHVGSSGGRRSPLWRLLEAFDAHSDHPLFEDHALRLATLLYPLYAERLRHSAGLPPDAVAQDLVGEALVNHFAARSWAPPRTICEAVSAILAAQPRFDADDPQLRSPRFLRRDWLPAALLLWRFRREADGGTDLAAVEEWERSLRNRGLRQPRPARADFEEGRTPRGVSDRKTPGEESRKKNRHRPRKGPEQERPSLPPDNARGGESPAPASDSAMGNDAPANPSETSGETGDAPRRRRRRRRGGRRHRRIDGDNGSTASAEETTARDL